jgi:hypothetical protein
MSVWRGAALVRSLRRRDISPIAGQPKNVKTGCSRELPSAQFRSTLHSSVFRAPVTITERWVIRGSACFHIFRLASRCKK